MTSTGYNTTTTCTLHYDRHPSRVHGVCVTSILSSTISTMHGAITTYKSIATLYLISRTSWDRSTVVCDQKYELSCLLLSRHDNDSSALSECTKVMPRKSAWQLLAESEKEQNKQQCPTKQGTLYYKTSGDFIIGGAVIAEQLVRYCNNRKTSNLLLFAFFFCFLLFAVCFLLFAFWQAMCFFLLWSPSNASSFLHLQLNQETGAGKEPKNSVVLNCFLIPDEDEIFFQINGKGKVIIYLVHLFPSFHSPEILITFYSNQH